jgi:hypothetical protein
METTAGFYRVDVNNDFQYAPNFVYGPTYTLLKEDKESYTYPTEGDWYWFDTEEDARIFLNVPVIN